MKCLGLFISFVLFAITPVTYASEPVADDPAHEKIKHRIDRKLKRYSWYPEVKRQIDDDMFEQPQDVLFNQIIDYLHVNLEYSPPVNEPCIELIKNGWLVTCYDATFAHNKEFLRVLDRPSTKKILKNATPWLILNGEDGYLNKGSILRRLSEESCKVSVEKCNPNAPSEGSEECEYINNACDRGIEFFMVEERWKHASK